MSEHQFHDLMAVDRPLMAAERSELRDISSRAEISATRFTNTDDYGDFRGDPAALMARFFDLHLYLADWGTRRLMVRLPRDAVDEAAFAAALEDCEGTTLRMAGGHLVLDIDRQSDDADEDWLPALARLREAALDGDARLACLAWLTAVSAGAVDEAAVEPLAGLGPLDPAMETFAAFFGIGVDLLAAAAERDGTVPAYDRRIADIRARHATKRTFIRRLDRTGAPPPPRR